MSATHTVTETEVPKPAKTIWRTVRVPLTAEQDAQLQEGPSCQVRDVTGALLQDCRVQRAALAVDLLFTYLLLKLLGAWRSRSCSPVCCELLTVVFVSLAYMLAALPCIITQPAVQPDWPAPLMSEGLVLWLAAALTKLER